MIPKIIHFIFGLAEDFGGKPFSFVHYMAIRSAIVCNPGYQVRYYYKYEPSGIYWDIVKSDIDLIPIAPPVEIYGRPLCHVAHQSDVVRLQLLFNEGGIYLDLDTITVSSFDSLLDHEMVMGVQGRGDKIDGLCNAVMMAAPNARFVQRWLEAYASFRSKGQDRYWDEHSVQLPMKLAMQNPDEITILDRGAFFYPSAEPAGVLDLFVEKKYFPAAYCHHLWEGLAWNLIKNLNERCVMAIDTTYNLMARRFITVDMNAFNAYRATELKRLMVIPMRINLGSGANPLPGWLNVDVAGAATSDMAFDITRPDWPLAPNSVGKAELLYAFSGVKIETVIKELYRVCLDGAIVRIKVPYPWYGWFLVDSNHSQPLLPRFFEMLDLEKCRKELLTGNYATSLALHLAVDFEFLSWQAQNFDRKNLNRTQIFRFLGNYFLMRCFRSLFFSRAVRRTANLSGCLANSTASEVIVTLRVRKSPATSAHPPGNNLLKIQGNALISKEA